MLYLILVFLKNLAIKFEEKLFIKLVYLNKNAVKALIAINKVFGANKKDKF